MFSSNQILKISGRNKETAILKDSIKLVLEGFSFSFNYYKEKEGTLIFYSYPSKDEMEGMIRIDESNQNVDYLLNLVMLYLSSNGYKKELNKSEAEDCWDGGNSPGWLMEVKPYNVSECIVIRPYWCFYAK